MSETTRTVSVEFVAKTDGAVAATKKLSDATRDQIDASEAAGKSQKQLGREVQRVRALQIEAADANRRAADAQRIHNLTVSKFGAASKEARESSAKLTRAKQEAVRAGTASAAALEKVSKAVTETARAEDGNLTPATKRLAAQLDRMGKEAERTASDLHKLDLQSRAAATGAGQLGKSFSALSVAGGNLLSSGVQRAVSGIGDAMIFSLKSAIDFESGMADVAKVVDGLKTPTGEATAQYHAMEAELFALSERIAVAPEGFAKIAAAAGQAGIAGSELTAFAEDAAKTSVAFGITADAAGEGLAKLRTGLKLNQESVMGLAGTMNHLSNSMASEASELLDAVQRVGSIGAAANVSGQEIAALASSMISAGAGSEMAATGTKNFLLALAAGTSATKAQIEAFQKLGLSAETVAENVTSQDMVTRAEQMKQVVARLAGLADADRISTLKQLFGSETVGTIGPLATNLDLLTQSLSLAADETAAASSVQAEFDVRSKTTANTLQLLKNNLSITAIAIGTELLPEVNEMARDLSAWVRENKALIKENVVGFLHGLSDAVKGLSPYVVAAGKAIGVATGLLGGMENAIGPVVVGLGVLKIASTAALGPWGTLAAGVVTGALAIKGAMEKAERSTVMAIKAIENKKLLEAQDRMWDADLQKASTADLIKMKATIEQSIKGARTIKGDMRGRSPALIADYEKMRQEEMAALKQRESALDAAIASKVDEIDATRKIKIETEATAAAELKKSDALKMQLAYLRELEGTRKLSKAQAARLEELERTGVGGPPPKSRGGGGKKGKAKKDTYADDLRDFNVEMDAYAFKLNKEAREESIAAQAAAWDKEEALFEKKGLAFDREMEMIEARGMAEEEAQAAREALLERRLDAEHKFAKEQAKMAKTDAQRERAETKLEQVEHQRRLLSLRKLHAAEQAEYAKKVAIYEQVTTHVNDLGSAMVDAAWDAAEGQRGAGLAALGDYLKMISRKATIEALYQTAQGVAAIAGITTAFKAPGHFLAAGKAAAVAIAAGGAGVGLSKAGEARAGSASPTMEAAANSPGYGSNASASGSSAEGINPTTPSAPKRELEATTVPISYYDPTQLPASSAGAGASVINIDLSGGTWYGAKGPEEAAQRIEKTLRQGKAAGKR